MQEHPAPRARLARAGRLGPRGPLLSFAAACAVLAASSCTRDTDGPKPASAAATAHAPADVAPAASASAAATATASAAGGGSGGAASGMPKDLNVLLVSIDAMRADMPWAGYPRDIAPVLTSLERKSVSYTRAYSVSSYTAMSLGGLLSGRYPSELDRSGYFFSNHPDIVLFFPELLQKAGVRTLSAHAHFYFDQKAGFRQGFDVYEILPGLSADNTTDRNITSPQHLETAKQILGNKANTGGRFFAWFHFLDPHDLYMPHPGISYGRKARDLYDGEMTFTDQHVGKLLEWVEQQEWGKRTAIVVTADHGEAFGEHKMYRHGFEIWEMLVHVPLFVHAPGLAPRRIDVPRSAVDLAPTILEILGMPPEPSFQGKSLVPELWGGAQPDEREVVIDLPRTSDNDRRRALVKGRYKLIAYGDDDGYDLFDVVSDPGETRDVKREQKAVFEDMKAAYKARAATIKDVCPKATEKLKGRKKGRKC